MRIRTLALALLLFAGCHKSTTAVTPPAPPPSNGDHTVTLAFSQTFADTPACSSTVTTSCINGFNEGYLNGTTEVQLHTDAASICTGSTQPETCNTSFTTTALPVASVTFYVVTTGFNSAGTAVTTSSASSNAVNVALDPATNLTATVE